MFEVCDEEGVSSKWPCSRLSLTLNNYLSARRFKYWLLSGVGWLCLTGLMVTCILSGFYTAFAYLTLMPLTGLIVRLTHGGSPRRLLDRPHSPWPRLVIVTNSLNDSDWSVFFGKSSTINALLNRPLFRSSGIPAPNVLTHLMRLIIGAQWILAVASCTQQDWNAVFISFWIFFCSIMSAYGYQPRESVQDWLRYTCGVRTKRIRATFSTRRALLSALLYLNPDSKDNCTDWIDPILSNKQERHDWESTALKLLHSDSCVNDSMKEKYWWKYLVEGVEVGRNIKMLFTRPSEGCPA